MSWHVETELLIWYQSRVVDRVTAASVEAHVTTCAECRDDLMVDTDWLDRSWAGIAEQVEPGERSIVERVLTWVGVSPHLARVMAVTPSLRPSWLIAVTLTLVFAGAASRLNQANTFDLFLVLAPMIPVAGVAVAYGRIGDPAHEITVAAPVDPLRLLLMRTALVTGFATTLSLIVDLAIPSPRGSGLWILPAFALTLLTLALGTRLTMWFAAGASAAAWLVLLTLFSARDDGRLTLVFGSLAQVAFMAVAVLAALVLVRNGDAYRRGDQK